MNNLKPCPLCGRRVICFTEKSPDGTITWMRILHGHAIDCGVSFIDDESEAVKKWNTRIDDKAGNLSAGLQFTIGADIGVK